MTLAETKRCTGCQTLLPRVQFAPRSRGSVYVASKCKACSSTKARAWREANRGRHAANYKRWVKADPERHAKRLREWRAIPENARKHRAFSLRWAKENPEQRRALMATTRARRRDAKTSVIPAAVLRDMLERQGSRCYYCQFPLKKEMHLEHRTPIVRGGKHVLENLCWSCPTCNLKKGRRTESEFVAWKGRAA